MSNLADDDTTKESDEKQTEKVLLDPYHYICQIPGKQVRTKLVTFMFAGKAMGADDTPTIIFYRTQDFHGFFNYLIGKGFVIKPVLAFNYWLNIPMPELDLIGEATQMLHNASLLIDDIEDNSNLRRGVPVAHKIYGVPHTINSANYVYFLGLEKALKLNHPEVTKVFTEQILELHRGQGMDIYWRDTVYCPSEEQYKTMVIRKTGGLFGLAVRSMQLFSANKSDFKPLLDNLGLYFQIRDDYANLYSEEYETNKSYCEDLTEGKFSFPLIHAILSFPEDNQVLSILRQRTTDNNVKKYCVQLLEKRGSFEYTRQTLTQLEDKIMKQVENHGGNPHLECLMKELRKIYQTTE